MAIRQELTRAGVESRVLDVTRELLVALGGMRALAAVQPGASFERDLGLGSLERVELLSRLEAEFEVELADDVLARAETPHDLVEALFSRERAATLEKRVVTSIGRTTLSPPAEAETLVDVLRLRAEAEPTRAHIYLQEDGRPEQVLTYGELLRQASAVAAGLARRGVEPCETVALMLPTGLDFFAAFFGALIAGAVPVPLYPPFSMDRLAEYLARQSRILENARARVLVTVSRGVSLGHVLKQEASALEHVTTVSNLESENAVAPTVLLTGDSPAFIQYTSGSTGDPKGVLLSHGNLLANVRAIGRAVDIGPQDAGASWLPLYHDMGLIGCWFTPLYFGISTAILSPLAFLSRPERWLWTIHARRATITAAPNFAFELCVRKIDDRKLEGLELSCWKAALNGAEPVLPDTLDRFTRKFARYGFKAESLMPVYGLAESTVALAVPPLGRKPRVEAVSREIFERERRAVPGRGNDRSPHRFVSVGAPLPGHEVRIVDAHGRDLGERLEGRLEFRGPSTMQGYYRNPEATSAIVREDGWVDSGDLAFIADGEIFITGRGKDLIIRGGRNLYPQEIESIVGEVEGVRRGCVVAFGVTDAREGTEKLVVVAETREKAAEGKDRLSQHVHTALTEALGVPADVLVLVPPKTVPKTSSGKLRRSACREQYLKGALSPTRRAWGPDATVRDLLRHRKGAWTALLRMGAGEALHRVRLAATAVARTLYGVYFGALALFVVLAFWLLALASPPRQVLSRAVSWGSRLFLFLTRCPFTVEGRKHLEGRGPVIFVSNHASYADPLPLMAALPPDFAFAVKGEAAGWPVIGTFIRKLGHVPVERMEASQSVADAARLQRVLGDGRSIVIFPEGTFTRATGIRPFKLGAFKLAAEAGAPLVPVAIRGTRSLLRDGNLLPRRTPIAVVIETPRFATSTTLEDVVRLRDEVAEILSKNSGEPRLDLVRAGFVPKR